MSPAALSARMRRLAELALGVAREVSLERQTDSFLWRERLEYRYALLAAWRGFENARVALAEARQRLEGESR